jgi:hypothetical protein
VRTLHPKAALTLHLSFPRSRLERVTSRTTRRTPGILIEKFHDMLTVKGNFIKVKVQCHYITLLLLKYSPGDISVKRKVLIEDVLGLFYAGDPVLFLVNMKTINCCLMLILFYLIWSRLPLLLWIVD